MCTGPGTGPADDILDAEPDAQETPVHAEADEHAGRVDANADQERLVRRFINVAHERLAGRDPGSRRLRARQPRERVVLGVLAPQDPPAEPVVTVQDLPAEPGVPVDQLPASEFGLTCLVEARQRRPHGGRRRALRAVPAALSHLRRATPARRSRRQPRRCRAGFHGIGTSRPGCTC